MNRTRSTIALLALHAVLVAACAAPTTRSSMSPAVPSWETIGESREGRLVRAIATGAGGPRVALVACIHGNEQEGLRHLSDLLEELADAPATVRVYEDANPDGTAAQRRTTSEGVDPNRNWPASNFTPDAGRGPRPLSEPAVAAVHRDLVAFDPSLVIVLHSTSRGPFVNYDGPAAGHAQRFADAAGGDWHVRPSMGYPTPGSLGTFMGVDRRVPILTIEFERGAPADETGPALMRGIEAVLREGPVELQPRVD